MLYVQSEWQSPSGKWHCNCVEKLADNSGAWYLPARILGMTPADFIEYLINNFHPDHFIYDKEKCFCLWSWTKQSDMRKYKNFINAAARKVNFQI